ncbi:MAG: hypothetical protein WA973_14050 [Mesorhizobium sp.]
MMSVKITPEMRALFGQIADLLIPAYKAFPAATAVGVHQKMLDDVLGFRPDLVDAFMRGLGSVDAGSLSKSINTLYRDDPEAFNAVSLAASAGYYMTPEVRAVLGYPGQESLTYDPHNVADYMTNHMLERVTRRGSFYRPTPVS